MVSLKYLEDKVAIPATGIKKQISNTKAFISDKDFGVGELCVAERLHLIQFRSFF